MFNVSFGDRCVFSEDTGWAASCAGSRTNLGTTRPTESLSVAIAPLNDQRRILLIGAISSHTSGGTICAGRASDVSGVHSDTATERIRKRGVGEGPYCPPKYMSGAGVCSRKKSGSRRYGPSGRIRIFPQVSIGGRCEFTEQEVVGGRCVTNGKEKTQPRTDDLSS